MKILYGVNSNGFGHINRSSIFINELMKMGHEVHILYAGKPPPNYALNLTPNTMYREGLRDICEKNQIKLGKTFFNFLFKVPKILRIKKEILGVAKKEKYDIYFADMELNVANAAKKIKKPCFNINHQKAVFFPTTKQLPGHHFDKFICKFLIDDVAPYYTRSYAIDYTDKIERNANVYRYPLIHKPELENYEVSREDHIVAYLANADYKRIINVFSKFPEETFYIYGFDEEKKINNLIFKNISRTGFLKDLTSAKAVIGNAGFSLTWEVCLINKLIWTIPYKHQYEQLVNADRLTKLGIAYTSKEITEEDFVNFRNWLEEVNYKPSIKLPVLKANAILDDIFSCLENINNSYS
ncbi:MAG: hypothetical protein JXA54_09850 [Candidatus Heimdallarchaeota archaeon]|nr:hypothetical protein [Candidatus Heimdallarchaeota archaeon]